MLYNIFWFSDLQTYNGRLAKGIDANVQQRLKIQIYSPFLKWVKNVLLFYFINQISR